MDQKDWLFDVEQLDGAAASVGFFTGQGEDTAPVIERGGKQVVPVPEGEWSNPVYGWLAECGAAFITVQRREDFPFYPVPELAIFAVDGAGGCFATAGGIGDLEEDCYPVVYVRDGCCCRVAPSLREFLRLICFCPGWRDHLGAFRQGTPAAAQDTHTDAHRAEAGRKAARILGLEENPDSLQILKGCLEQEAGVKLYPNKTAAAGKYRFFELI